MIADSIVKIPYHRSPKCLMMNGIIKNDIAIATTVNDILAIELRIIKFEVVMLRINTR